MSRPGRIPRRSSETRKTAKKGGGHFRRNESMKKHSKKAVQFRAERKGGKVRKDTGKNNGK